MKYCKIPRHRQTHYQRLFDRHKSRVTGTLTIQVLQHFMEARADVMGWRELFFFFFFIAIFFLILIMTNILNISLNVPKSMKSWV